MRQIVKVKPYSLFVAILRSELKEEVVTEYKFHPQRKYEFDIAIPKWKVAVEVEGGLFKDTRKGFEDKRGIGHTGIKGILRDMEKYNLATEEGWRVLRYTPEQTKKSSTLEQIRKTIKLIYIEQQAQAVFNASFASKLHIDFREWVKIKMQNAELYH